MSDDPWEDPTVKQWVRHVIDEMVPKMRESAVAMHIVPGEEGIDVKFCVELGAAIMLDKPIIAVALGPRDVPKKLKLIADEIVYLPDGVNEQAGDLVAEALKRVVGGPE